MMSTFFVMYRAPEINLPIFVLIHYNEEIDHHFFYPYRIKTQYALSFLGNP